VARVLAGGTLNGSAVWQAFAVPTSLGAQIPGWAGQVPQRRSVKDSDLDWSIAPGQLMSNSLPSGSFIPTA
jgi:hypothetical protein